MIEILKQHFNITRIGALYKDFTNYKELNPEGYEANIQSWEFIFQVLLGQKFDQFTIPPKSILSTNLTLPTIGTPLSISVVVDELVERRILIPESFYLDYNGNFHELITPSMARYLSPTHWISSTKYTVMSSLGFSTRYIHWPTLVKYADTFLQSLDLFNYTDKLYTSKHLLAIIRTTAQLTDLDFRILIKYLKDLGKIKIKYIDGEDFIKFETDEVAESDIGIAQLKWNIYEMNLQLDNYQYQINLTKNKINLLVKENSDKTRIMTLLHTKKVQESSLEKLANTLDNLTTVLMKMDDATSNNKVYSTLAQSAKVLKELNQVKIEDIEDVHEELGLGQDLGVDQDIGSGVEQDIEEEYDQLVKEMNPQDIKETKNSATTEQENSETDLIKRLQDLKVSKKPITKEEPQQELVL